MKWHSYLNSASQILVSYKGDIPFHHFIRQFFKQDKKYGSRDRRVISQLCYGYLRLGGTLSQASLEDKMLAGYFLTAAHRDELLLALRKEWYDWWASHPAATHPERIGFLKNTHPELTIEEIFPFPDHLGGISDPYKFMKSHLIQPDVYLRVRPGHKKTVLLKLENAGISFQMIAPATIAVPSSAPVDQVLQLNKEAVIQDASSQMVGDLMEKVKGFLSDKNVKVWDCCAASGGKSILVKDVVGKMELTVSDVRESVLYNLKTRMKEAGIAGYRSFVADLASDKSLIPLDPGSLDLVIADVPCSGAGTWARTPEQLSFFQQERLVKFSDLQKKITVRTLRYIKKGGALLYITCSVFREENEDMVKYLQEEQGLQLVQSSYLEGFSQKADTLFAALFIV